MGTPVVYDVNVLVDAAPAHGGDALSWPSLPPRTGSAPRDAIGAINDRRDFSLWLSPHIIENTRRVLGDYGYPSAEVDQYIDVLVEIAEGSGGGVVDPPRTVHANRDFEDNLILDLAAETNAVMIVSSDKDLLDMPMWRGTPVIRPKDFAGRADAAWRGRTRAEQQSTTDLMRRRMEKASSEALNSHHADHALQPSTPESYRQLREVFDADHARLTEIVGGWNPHNDKVRPRIEQWQKNLAFASRQAAEADALVETNPDIAHQALSALEAKLDFALDKMDPRRPQGGKAQPARSRASLSVVDEAPAPADERQYGN